MPTNKRRDTITDTRETGKQTAREASQRRAAIEETAGALTGAYRPNELERLREDWPTSPLTQLRRSGSASC